jgi:4-amino-4-deoxy-L-arabinose transferase-like glycosyltransferase
MWDPIEYYSLGINLHEGQGFNLDYIWNFASDPEAVTHPLDHWLPLSGIVVAGSFALFGVSFWAALLPFVLLSGLQSLLVYGYANRIGISLPARIFASLATAYIPWLFVSSLRTDTTTLFGVLAFGCLATVYLGFTENSRWFWLAGLCAGLASLTRNDGPVLIPAAIGAGMWFTWRGCRFRWIDVLGAAVMFALVLLPWMMRNQSALGTPWPGDLVKSMFVTDHEDFYAYSKDISLQTYLDQGIPSLVGKILFELAASVKLMLVLPGMLFTVAIVGGLVDSFLHRHTPDHFDLAPYFPALLFVLLTFAAYGILLPYMSQGGSFKKAFLSMLPFLIILGASAIERALRSSDIYKWIVVLVLVLMVADAVELTRSDFNYNNTEQTRYEHLKRVLDTLDDDREIIVMTRDPWSVNLVTHYRAVMVPNESIDVILEVADRYGVTYILTPCARPSLDQLYNNQATHPRLEEVADLREDNMRLYRIRDAE